MSDRGAGRGRFPYFDVAIRVIGASIFGILGGIGGICMAEWAAVVGGGGDPFLSAAGLFGGAIAGGISGTIYGGASLPSAFFRTRGDRRARRVQVWRAVAIGGCLLGLSAAACWSRESIIEGPSDGNLVTTFMRREPELDELQRLLTRPLDLKAGTALAPAGDGKPLHLTQKQVPETLAQLRATSVPRTDMDGGIEVEVWIWIDWGGVSSKGYAYLPTPPKEIVSSLDQIPDTTDFTGTVYRHVHGNWYLYSHWSWD